MPTGVFAAYYPFDTYAVANLTTEEKVAALGERFGQAEANMAWAAGHMKLTDFLGFFAVPEYFFLKKHQVVGTALAVELYDEPERDAIYGQVASLSRQRPKVVLLPGTVNWRRKLPAPARVTRQGKPVDVNYDGLSSAPAFLAGHLLASYEKRMNDRTIDNHVADTRFVPGTSSPLFDVGALRCGIEVCGDFAEGNLSKSTGPMTLDFEFLMSAHIKHVIDKSNLDKIPVRNGGYFLHVDQNAATSAQRNGVWCLSRGTGWHGVESPIGGFATDPWTLRPVRTDQSGTERSVGSVSVLRASQNFRPTSGLPSPDGRATAGLQLSAEARVSGALDNATGLYEVTLSTTLMTVGDSTSEVAGRAIAFDAEGAQVAATRPRTDAEGVASASFRCHRDRPAKLIAEFHGAKVIYEAEIAWLGPGEVTKIATLKGLPHDAVPTYFTPI